MTVNAHITEAIDIYRRNGRDFHEVMSWHLLHGVVMITPEFLCLGHYCRAETLSKALPLPVSDTTFVTYFAGDMRGLKAVAPEGIDFIAFERGFKNLRGLKVYSMEKFKHLLH